MNNNKHTAISVKTAALVENHSLLFSLLAMLCLLFAVNFFLTGPGSDGGSGLGGTGRTGGESGFGGTGKAPDSGPGFKLSAYDNGDKEKNNEQNLIDGPADLHDEIVQSLLDNQLALTDTTEFDVTMLRLTPEAIPGSLTTDQADDLAIANNRVAALVQGTELTDQASAVDLALAGNMVNIASDTLGSSLDILDSLMLAEAEARVGLPVSDATIADDSTFDSTMRTRVVMPVRPERPDRLSMPSRITPVQRVDIPAPPPVRPMRTLSAILNR